MGYGRGYRPSILWWIRGKLVLNTNFHKNQRGFLSEIPSLIVWIEWIGWIGWIWRIERINRGRWIVEIKNILYEYWQ